MKYVVVFYFLFVSFVYASPLDYTKEAEVASHDISVSLKRGDTEKLRFALERLTISCNMLELEDESLPAVCIRWLSILKKGCGSQSKEKSLKECAQKLSLSKKERKPYIEKKVIYTTSSPPIRDGGYFLSSLSHIYHSTQESFNRQYRSIVRNSNGRHDLAHAVNHLDHQWARFLYAYHYYSGAVTHELYRGDTQKAALLIERFKIAIRRIRAT